jgi:branched-chain amino acid transport system ATP-binding protein
MGLARTFQIVKPFHRLSTLENVAVAGYNRSADARKVEEQSMAVLELLGLAHKALAPAESLTTPDRKRLELARALATSPRLILLDETMAGLNPTEQLQVVELMKKIRERGIAILIIEHHMRVIMRLCDRITILHHGVRIATGDPRSVCRNQDVIDAYLGKEHAFAAP